MGSDRTIGIENRIPWDIPEDMQNLRKVTKGCPLIMGRATYESICAIRGIDGQRERAMPGRLNVVVTRNADYFPNGLPKGVMLATTPKQGLNLAYDFASNAEINKIFVFGGTQIYAALMGDVERLYLTEIDHAFNGDAHFPEFDHAFNGDAHFPEFDRGEWVLRQEMSKQSSDANYRYALNVYDRKMR